MTVSSAKKKSSKNEITKSHSRTKSTHLPFLLSVCSFLFLMYASTDIHWSHLKAIDENRNPEVTYFGIWKYCTVDLKTGENKICGESLTYLNQLQDRKHLVREDCLKLCRVLLFVVTTMTFLATVFTLAMSFKDTLDGLWVLLTQILSATFTLCVLILYTHGRWELSSGQHTNTGIVDEDFGYSFYMVIGSEIFCILSFLVTCMYARLEKIARILCLA
eukprot:TCONS_00056659-protein